MPALFTNTWKIKDSLNLDGIVVVERVLEFMNWGVEDSEYMMKQHRLRWEMKSSMTRSEDFWCVFDCVNRTISLNRLYKDTESALHRQQWHNLTLKTVQPLGHQLGTFVKSAPHLDQKGWFISR